MVVSRVGRGDPEQLRALIVCERRSKVSVTLVIFHWMRHVLVPFEISSLPYRTILGDGVKDDQAFTLATAALHAAISAIFQPGFRWSMGLMDITLG